MVWFWRNPQKIIEKMRKLKICILQNGLARGETPTFVINLCKGIDKECFENSYISKQTLKYLNQIQETYAKIFQTSLLSNG